MDDSDSFPLYFDAWEQRAKGQAEEAKRHGLIITLVPLDPDEFLAFCEVAKMSPNREARVNLLPLAGQCRCRKNPKSTDRPSR